MSTGQWRKYGDDERRRQVEELAKLCWSLAEILRAHGEEWPASMFAERAQAADRLIADGWDQAALTDLGARFPEGVEWLNPKAVDYGAARQPWQEEVAAIHAKARRLALDVRAVATFE